MKILAYGVRPDERDAFQFWTKEYQLDVTLESQNLTIETVSLAQGYETIVFLADDTLNGEVLQQLKNFGISAIFSRSAGVDNVDFETADKLGISIANVPKYSPNSVSEFTLLSILSLLRNYKHALVRSANQDFTIAGLTGREIRNQVISVIGTGHIGYQTIKHLTGFSPKEILVYDIVSNDEVATLARYTSLDEIYQKSDVIVYHIPLTSQTHHMINKDSLSKMKKGVILVNVSRGGIMNSKDTLEFLRSGVVGGIILDVYEHESTYYRHDWREKYISDEILREFLSFPNVIVTPHLAFYTDEAIANMVATSLNNLKQYFETGSCTNTISRK